MCDEWKNDKAAFFKWALENGYEDSLSIDRVDVYGSYCPENCRWATVTQQARNKKSTIRVAFGGKELSIHDWADLLGLNHHTVVDRYRRGEPPERILSAEPLKPKKKPFD